MHFIETKPAAQRIIYHGQGAVGGIHHSDDVHVLRDKELLILVSESQFLAPVVLLDEHQEFTEDFGQVPSVNLVDNEEMRLVRVVGCIDAELVEDASLQLEITS